MKKILITLLILLSLSTVVFAAEHNSDVGLIGYAKLNNPSKEDNIQRISIYAGETYYFTKEENQKFVPLVRFNGSIDFNLFSLGLGLEAMGGCSFVPTKGRLVRIDVAAGAGVSESGYILNAVGNLFKKDSNSVKADIGYSVFGDASVLFGLGHLSARGGIRLGLIGSKDTKNVCVAPYFAVSADIFRALSGN